MSAGQRWLANLERSVRQFFFATTLDRKTIVALLYNTT
jgi:hypothetical protein